MTSQHRNGGGGYHHVSMGGGTHEIDMEESAGPEPYQRNHPALREHQNRGRVGQRDNEGNATRSKREIKERIKRKKRKMI